MNATRTKNLTPTAPAPAPEEFAGLSAAQLREILRMHRWTPENRRRIQQAIAERRALQPRPAFPGNVLTWCAAHTWHALIGVVLAVGGVQSYHAGVLPAFALFAGLFGLLAWAALTPAHWEPVDEGQDVHDCQPCCPLRRSRP